MNLDQNREIVSRLYMEVTTRKPYSTVYRTRGSGFTQYAISAKPSILKTFNQFFSSVSKAFPEFEVKLDNLSVKEDRVMVRYTILGVQKGTFMGIEPTHQPMSISGIDVFRLDNGRVVEHWEAAHQVNAFSGFNQEASPISTGRRPDKSMASPPGRQ